ncbi:MAG TPA: V-type ATPase 116kDa subunit family protein [Treponemataceae bacterium]|nr:V-type ATPase 116kDa subunit family protein [Treponemataceae bacterium]HPS44064.1 V-type ATPase 116kDa subunit family protein [Treponemataceae bacterium]
MLKTARMRLLELMVLHEDIDRVLEYLGKKESFQLRREGAETGTSRAAPKEGVLANLELSRLYLGIPDLERFSRGATIPAESDGDAAHVIIAEVNALREREKEAAERDKQTRAARDEARAFANLKVPYSEFEHLSFLTLRIGKLDPENIEPLSRALGDRAAVVPLGEDRTRVLAASSKKGRFALDSELRRFGFIPLEVPKDFMGVPDDVLASLDRQAEGAAGALARIADEKRDFARARGQELIRLLEAFSLDSQVRSVRDTLEGTQLVYRVMGWVAESDAPGLTRELEELTEGRVAVRSYAPEEVPSIRDGTEKVPVKFKHGPVVKSFERMVFSYGAPLYGTVDPTPVVAFFFTLLFGIMFGDLGQGGVFFFLGIALISGKVPFLSRWRHFGPLFATIGLSSMAMGLLTGEVFANGELLKPVSRAITARFGAERDRILELMPQRGAMTKLIYFFGFTLVIGFIVNSLGLLINIVNQFSLRKPARAIFGKTGLCGAFFFWYAVFASVRIAVTRGAVEWYDIVCFAIPLALLFFSEPITRYLEGERPVLENGVFAAAIGGIVELLETVSTVISNSVSFLRVGAFALSHAVLSYIVFTMTDLVGGSLSAGGLLVGLFGNAIIIFLEGLIVAIQVVRLQYYEFFSKFFTETGKEFTPFRFVYKEK